MRADAESADRLRVAVMGSSEFVLPSLDRLIDSAGYDVVAIYTRAPAAQGRGQRLRRTVVHERALAAGIPVETPARLRDEGALARLAGYAPELVVTGAYGLILPKPLLDLPRFGCINLHASLLPRWRGAAPIERAILAGDARTGVCLFKTGPGLDTGPVYARGVVPIGAAATATTLRRELAELAAELLVPTLAGIVAGSLPAMPQEATGATYAEKPAKEEGRLDFERPADDLARIVRALDPRPGAFVVLAGERIGVHRASVVQARGMPGEVVAGPLVVACGADALRLEIVQRAGRKAMAAADLLRGWPLPVGARFDPASGTRFDPA